MLAAKRRIDPVGSFAELFAHRSAGLPGARDARIAEARAGSFARFTALGFPTPKAETWKYTNIGRVANVPMALAPPVTVPLDKVEPHLLGGPMPGGPEARRLIFVNGHFQPQWSNLNGLPEGAIVASLSRAIEQWPDMVAAALARPDDERALTHLNTAFTGDGVWIDIADGVTVEQPIQLLFLTASPADTAASEPSMTHPRCFIRLGDGAALSLIETHVGLGGERVLTNLVTEVVLGQRARLAHDRVQLLGPGGSHIGRLDGRIAAEARYVQTTATSGGTLVRNENEVQLTGSNIECLLNGLGMPRGNEHVDTLIRMHHMAPNCHSDQFYKHVVDERGHAVFAGKIIVHKDAQKTNAYQKNDNLLLSDDAEIDTKPELEIYADDVKCSHGATCGDLDPTALFYLRARGLPHDHARSLLTFAFAGEVIERFTDASVGAYARKAAAERVPGGAVLEDVS